MVTGLSESDLRRHESGDKVAVGDVSRGVAPQRRGTRQEANVSWCRIGSCRRYSLHSRLRRSVDLPGANPEEMYYTLTQRLASLPDHIGLYPGHNYSEETSSTLAPNDAAIPTCG
jgi:hypothetical protein